MLASQRGLFTVPREICYLNSASYSPLPLKTQEAARAAIGRKGQPWKLPASYGKTYRSDTRTRVFIHVIGDLEADGFLALDLERSE